jgi:hypothetical protein
MLGAIIGDIVGSRWEFEPTNDYNFEWLSEENGFTDILAYLPDEMKEVISEFYEQMNE